jgi:enoyl-CoA hydratase/carnithine racemase
MAFKTLKFEEPEPGIGLLALSRPERLNAMSMGLVEELHLFFAQLKASEQVRVLIITGEGRGFCSGADLKETGLKVGHGFPARAEKNPGQL